MNKLKSDNNCFIAFDVNGYSLKDKTTQQILLHGPSSNGLYLIQPLPSHHLSYMDLSATPQRLQPPIFGTNI